MEPIANIDDLLCWQDLRIAIEVETSFLAAQRRSEADAAAIEKILLQMREDEEWRYMSALDFDFHRAIAISTKNDLLVASIDSLNVFIRSWIDAVIKTSECNLKERQSTRVEEHAAIAEAIRARDPETARRVMRLHIENGRTRLLAALARFQPNTK